MKDSAKFRVFAISAMAAAVAGCYESPSGAPAAPASSAAAEPVVSVAEPVAAAAVAALAPAPEAAAGERALEMRTSPNGGISFADGTISILAYAPGWSALRVSADWAAAEEDAQNIAGAAGHPVVIFDEDGSVAFKGRAVWSAGADGTVAGSIRLRCENAVSVQCVVLAANIPAEPPAGLGDSVVSQFDLPTGAGTLLRAEFSHPVPVHSQDSHAWGGAWSVRFGDDRKRKEFSPGDELSWEVTLSAPCGIALQAGKPVTIKPDGRWAQLDYRKDIHPGSALDFSPMGLQDAPAGKYGWLKAVGGHFEFEGLPGVQQRFYGVNLCFSAQYLSHEDSDMLVDRFVRCGYNTIRVHHHDGMWFKSEENRERLDYLLARAFERGLYVTTDLYVSRPVPWRDIGFDRDGIIEKQLYKTYIGIHDPSFRDWAAHAKAFLEHVNPYTGRAYKDEPGMPLVSLVNEGKLQMGWGKEKKAHDPLVRAAWKQFGGNGDEPDGPGSQNPDSPHNRFDDWVNRRIYQRGSAFVRSLGCKALLTNDNNGRWHGEGEGSTPLYDYVDSHFYVDHPSFLDKPWKLPSRCDNNNPIPTDKPALLHRGWAKGASKPYAITEWNFSGPGRYRGMGGILTGALAAQQEWDGLWRFAYSHSDKNLGDEPLTGPGYFDCVTDPLIAASDRASVCLFLRGDGVDETALRLDRDRGSMTLDTPLTCGGFAESGEIHAGPLSFGIVPAGETPPVPATLWVSSLDGAPVGVSSRLLLVHLTDVQGGGARYADESRTVLTSWGKGCLVEDGAAQVELRLDAPEQCEVFELDTAGARVGLLEAEIVDGALRFAVRTRGPHGGRIYYEIVRKPSQARSTDSVAEAGI